jgi:hypothetical protein
VPPKFSFSFVWVILIGASQPEKKEKEKLDEATQNRSFYFGKFPYKLLETNPKS